MNFHYPDWNAARYATDEGYRSIEGARYLKRAAFNDPCRVIIGAEGKGFPGWVVTDKAFLEVTDEKSWREYFVPGVIHSVLAEHVFEHLTEPACRAAFRNIHKFLVQGGDFLVSVPDGYHPNQGYLNQVRPGGTGEGANYHKMLWRMPELRCVLEDSGFVVHPIEYWSKGASFHRVSECPHREHLRRTFCKDHRNREGVVAYTSLILRAIKE